MTTKAPALLVRVPEPAGDGPKGRWPLAPIRGSRHRGALEQNTVPTLSFEGETYQDIVRKVRRWLASAEAAPDHLGPSEVVERVAARAVARQVLKPGGR